MALPSTELIRWAIAGLCIATLAIAAVRDIRSRRIPNWCVVVIIVLGAAWPFVGPATSPLLGLAAGALAFAATLALFALGIVGAGDSKLFAATAFFLGLGYLAQFAFVTAIAGGALALAVLAMNPTRALVLINMRGKGDFGDGIPYGVAIAIGGAVVIVCALTGQISALRYF